ncbi:hypothetical protein [Streptomyces sp. SPB162]|uniref:hypothetical protein n=1 Tax=Streptomyces sp. SPB162 TaxID=2940560 RepID=UPI0024052E06|nr:hypothetical protein [Streptomyces sp. SPB162]MDF9815732.1 hypothetical protein [Streptomyces sp. SPB162]
MPSAKIRDVSNGDPVRWNTSTASATSAKKLPNMDSTWAAKIGRNSRTANTVRYPAACGSTGSAVAPAVPSHVGSSLF